MAAVLCPAQPRAAPAPPAGSASFRSVPFHRPLNQRCDNPVAARDGAFNPNQGHMTSITIPPRDDDDLLRLPEVRRETRLSRTTIYRLMGRDEFPRSLKLTEKLVCWRWAEIRDWKRSRPLTRRVS